MHEMSLCEGVVRLLEEQSRLQDFSRVQRVTLEVGALSYVVPESMEMCFMAVTRGTLAEGAELVMERTPGRAWCEDCEEEVAIGQRIGPCPLCGGFRLQVRDGDGLKIKELEVD